MARKQSIMNITIDDITIECDGGEGHWLVFQRLPSPFIGVRMLYPDGYWRSPVLLLPDNCWFATRAEAEETLALSRLLDQTEVMRLRI